MAVNYGSANVKRVDFMQFKPVNTMSASGIEKGEFICYEIKSCLNDYNSGHGQNFIGELNYFVMPMSLYKELKTTLMSPPNYHIGVIVPIPKGTCKATEFENPTEINFDKEWELTVVKPAHPQNRKYSLVELLFCMLRSGKDILPVSHNENSDYSECDEFICSVCGVHLKDWVRFDEEDNTFEFVFNYCPNCGAKIDEKEGI